MKVDPGSVVVGLVGALVLRLSLTRTYLLYVKSGMRPWLILAGGVLVVVAIARLARRRRQAEGEPQHDDDHVPGPAWLLIVPIVLLLVVLPSPLGSFQAGKQTPNQLSAFSTDPLPPLRDGAADVNIASFVGLIHKEPTALQGVPLRLVGFVARDHDRFLLTRFWMTCCAADAIPIQVVVEGAPPAPAADTWVEVVGQWRSPTGRTGRASDLPAIVASGITKIARPSNPYAN